MLTLLPPLPPWSQMHPILVHFPIAILTVAPIFVVIGLFLKPERTRASFLSALLLLVIGTGSALVAKEAGEAAEDAAKRASMIPEAAKITLELHSDTAETAILIFTVLTLLFAVLVVLSVLRPQFSTPVFLRVLPVIFLLFYAAGLVKLMNAGYLGGRLVHEYGIRAHAPAETAPSR